MSHKSRILVIDDNRFERELLADLLQPQGYELAFAVNGAEGLMKAAEFDPDLILLDIMMPEMDGFEVCQRLRADAATAELPIIMVTALNDREPRIRGIEAGADDFITKPFDSVELRARIRTITRLNRYRRLMAERVKFERVVEHADTGFVLIDEWDEVLFANPKGRLYLNMPQHITLPAEETFLNIVKNQYQLEPTRAWVTWPEEAEAGMVRYLVRPETASAQAIWVQVDILDHLTTTPEPIRIISLRDVTAEMTAQRDRRKFHTMITHKLRTPFISILTGLELMINHSVQLSHAEIVDLSKDAYKWAKRLYDDIEEIIRYVDSPALAGPDLGLNLVQLPVLVANVCAGLGVQTVSVSGSDDLAGRRILLSKQAMEVILWEILGNAKKFHPQKQPTVEIVAAYENVEEVTIQISDDGLTLSPEQLTQMWLPYYQGEKYFTGQVKGMGLGLSLVASLVWSVGGRCRVHNRVARPGVTIDLTLPCHRVAKKGQSGNGARILSVDSK